MGYTNTGAQMQHTDIWHACASHPPSPYLKLTGLFSSSLFWELPVSQQQLQRPYSELQDIWASEKHHPDLNRTSSWSALVHITKQGSNNNNNKDCLYFLVSRFSCRRSLWCTRINVTQYLAWVPEGPRRSAGAAGSSIGLESTRHPGGRKLPHPLGWRQAVEREQPQTAFVTSASPGFSTGGISAFCDTRFSTQRLMVTWSIDRAYPSDVYCQLPKHLFQAELAFSSEKAIFLIFFLIP